MEGKRIEQIIPVKYHKGAGAWRPLGGYLWTCLQADPDYGGIFFLWDALMLASAIISSDLLQLTELRAVQQTGEGSFLSKTVH